MIKWFGPNRKYHFAGDLTRGSKLDENSEAHLIKLLAGTSGPSIIKATAVHCRESIGTQGSLNTILEYVKDMDAQVRYEATRSLMKFPFDQ